MRYALGVDLGGTHLAAGLVSEKGEVLSFASEGLPRKSAWSITRQIGKLVQRLSEEASVAPCCIGLGLPGLVNTKLGLVHQSPHFPAWHEAPIQQLLANQFALPFSLQNDGNMFAYGELHAGAGQVLNDFIFLTLGSGIGAGIVLHGELVTGPNGLAGEVAHMTLDANGPQCNCGNKGCWELYAASQSFTQYLATYPELSKNFSSAQLSLAELASEAKAGKAAALEFWRWYGERLALGLNSLMNIFGVQNFILSGGIMQAKDFFFAAVLQKIKTCAYRHHAQNISLQAAALGQKGGVVGSALYALNSLRKAA